jgi:hypothetical protein
MGGLMVDKKTYDTFHEVKVLWLGSGPNDVNGDWRLIGSKAKIR